MRVAVGDCLEALAGLRGAAVLEACMERVLFSIHEHYVSARDKEEAATSGVSPLCNFVRAVTTQAEGGLD